MMKFNSIKNEGEFRDLAGDSYDVVRHFFQKMHEQLMIIKKESSSIFSKYILSGPNNNMSNNDVQSLNNAINTYAAHNKTIIANLFYFIERSFTKCGMCGHSSSNFNVQMSVIFALEDIRQWLEEKTKPKLTQINTLDNATISDTNTNEVLNNKALNNFNNNPMANNVNNNNTYNNNMNFQNNNIGNNNAFNFNNTL